MDYRRKHNSGHAYITETHHENTRKLAEKKPDEVKITTNKDGSIYATMPLSYLKFNAPLTLTEERKEKLREQAKIMNEKRA